MRKIKLKVPVNSLISAKHQIKAGADELYMAFDSENFNNISFSGRMRNTCGKEKSEVEYGEFKEIVKYAHYNNKIVEFAANVRSIMDDHCGGNSMQKKFLDYVEKGIVAGADRVILADIGSIMLMKEYFPEVPITGSVYLETYNVYQLKLLESMGVKKIVLDHGVAIEEIEALVKNSNMEIEVFGMLGCSFIQYTCSLNHSGVKKVNLGMPCRANYKIKNSGKCQNILDVTEGCTLCTLPKFRDAGVSSLKIVGRDLPLGFSVSVTRIFSEALSMIEEGMRSEEIPGYLASKFDFEWWIRSNCREKKCEYSKINYYI